MQITVSGDLSSLTNTSSVEIKLISNLDGFLLHGTNPHVIDSFSAVYGDELNKVFILDAAELSSPKVAVLMHQSSTNSDGVYSSVPLTVDFVYNKCE